MDYLAIIHKESDSDFGVSFPDFPGCITAGSSLDEARRMAAEALEMHIEGLTEDGADIPAPSSLDDVIAGYDIGDGVVCVVPFEGPPRTVRVNITLNHTDLAAIDRFAESEGMTRSGFLAKAAKDTMNRIAAGNSAAMAMSDNKTNVIEGTNGYLLLADRALTNEQTRLSYVKELRHKLTKSRKLQKDSA